MKYIIILLILYHNYLLYLCCHSLYSIILILITIIINLILIITIRIRRPKALPKTDESDRLQPYPKPMKVTDRGLSLSSLGQSYSSQAEPLPRKDAKVCRCLILITIIISISINDCYYYELFLVVTFRGPIASRAWSSYK